MAHVLLDALDVSGRGDAVPAAFDRVLADGITLVVWSGVSGGRGLRASGNVPRVCGCGAGDLLAAPSSVWIDRAHPADYGRVEAAYRALLVTGEPFDEEYRWVRFDGSTIWLHGRAVLRPGAEPVIDGLFTDVTERRRLLDEINHLQKVEAIGEFTSGIAHDFNNLLAIILANASLLLENLDGADPRWSDARAVYDTAERAAALTRQLLPFTRKHAFEPRAVDLNAVVTAAEPLLRRVIGRDIEFRVRLSPALPAVRADGHLLEQVLMNLAANARDAMPDGGTLTIETSSGDGRVRLAVSDTGCGMDAATRLRVFEPFFTTKATGHGTGLGLAASQTIVGQCGGVMRVDSEPGHGTVFEVVLAAIDESPASVDGRAAERSWREFTGDERILLVEDEDGVRALIHRMLASAGYDVQCARDGQEALAIVQAQPLPFDLLLTDVIMPRGTGADVAQRLARSSPATRALFISGHSLESLVQRGLLEPDQPFLHKPFTPAGLARRVRETLDAYA